MVVQRQQIRRDFGAVVQAKAGNLSTAQQLEQRAGRGITLTSNTRTYEDVLDAVAVYHDNASTPANDHGVQLFQLSRILPLITAWEQKYGATTQAVVNRKILGLSRTDKRRQVLDSVRTQVPVEDNAVRQQGLAQANAEHLADRTQLLQYVQEGLQQNNDRTLRNSCDWILNAGKTILYAATPTGDAYMRVHTAGGNPAAAEAFFPEGVAGAAGAVTGASVSYNEADLADNTNVTLTKSKRTGGWNDPGSPGLVVVVRPATKSKAKVWETLRHEVQHDADKHKGREQLSGLRQAGETLDASGLSYADLAAPLSRQDLLALVARFPDMQTATAALRTSKAAMAAGMAEIQLASYKTEFRAYSYQEGTDGGTYTALDNTAQNVGHDGHMFSARQLAIFLHIYGGYDHTKKGWDQNPLLGDGATRFQTAVAAYWRPDTEGYNKYNSARVDDFYRALEQVGTLHAATSLEVGQGRDAAPVQAPEANQNDATVQAVLLRVNSLTHDDAQYILNESPAMLAKINTHLGGQARIDVMTALAQQ